MKTGTEGSDAAFVRDGRLASYVYFKTGNEVKRWTHTKDVNSVVLSRDASTMLTGCDELAWSSGDGPKAPGAACCLRGWC